MACISELQRPHDTVSDKSDFNDCIMISLFSMVNGWPMNDSILAGWPGQAVATSM